MLQIGQALAAGVACPLDTSEALEAFQRAEDATGKKMNYVYEDKNREGDHMCYISDLSKCREHYPGWDIEVSLETIFEEIANAWMTR